MKTKRFLLFVLVCFAVLAFTSPVLAQGENPPIVVGEVSPNTIIAFLAVAMSLFFDYFPGVAQWYEKLSESNKKLIALGLAVAVVVIAFALTCANVFSTSLVCTTS